MTKWEYRQEIFQGIELLNAWGEEGWEIAGFFGKDGAFMILKRQIRGRSVVPAGDAPAASPSASAGGGARSSTSSSSSSSRSTSSSRSGTASSQPKGKFKEMI
jgi:hypothetical protein